MTPAANRPQPSRRVLFVDDDPQLLSGLGKGLRKHRDRWAMVFADSGEAALAEIRRAAFDVVVSDMRMPVMDGAALLAHVRDHDPTTMRMILSGFSDRNAIVRALPVAHQFFNKPCDLSELSRAIDRACDLRALFSSDAVRAVIAALGGVPPAPGMYHELSALLGRTDGQADKIAAVVEQDAGLSARVLELASSPVFGGGNPLGSVADAVSRLGVEAVVGLALAAHAFALAGDRPLPGLALAALQHHSLQVARAARAAISAREAAGDAFIAGLVHEIGKVVIAVALPDAHAAIVQQGRAEEAPGSSSSAAERSVLGTTHAEIGAYLLGLWGLPLPIIHAIAHHNDPAAEATPVLAALRTAHAQLAGE